jgi:hypothetical protein
MVLTEEEEASLLRLVVEAEEQGQPIKKKPLPFRPYAVVAAVRAAGVAYWKARRRERPAVSASREQRRDRLLELAGRAADTNYAVATIKVSEVYHLLGLRRKAGKIAEIEQIHELTRDELKALLESCAAELDSLFPEHKPHLDEAIEGFVRALRQAVDCNTNNIDTRQPIEALTPEEADPELRWGSFRWLVENALRIVDPGLPDDLKLLRAVRRRGKGVGMVQKRRKPN